MPRSAFTWHINRPLTVVALLLFPLLLSLGFWQLSRADEKRIAQRDFAGLRAAEPVGLSALSSAPANYTNLRVRGVIDNERTLLIDNRILQGRFGYEVVSPLRAAGSEHWLLINRGWIAADAARRSLPVVPPVDGEVEVRGHLYRDRAGFELAGEAISSAWPRVVSHLDFEQLASALQVSLPSYSLRLDAESPAALTVDWRVVNMDPAQHVGYAVQWFSMAAVLVLAWLFASSNLWQVIRGAAAAPVPDGGESRDD